MSKFLLVLIFVLALGFTSANAQNFSTHQVKKGETVETIAKQYYVTSSDIYALNPDAKKKLKSNTILIIPISKANKPNIKIVKELQGFTKHKTRRKETLYSLAKQYNVSEDDIKKHNKFLYANPLRKGDKLQIPIFKITEEVEQQKTKVYTVLPKEGKWRIAYKFGISLNELEALNPDMGDFLKVGQQIVVPNIDTTNERIIDEHYSYYKVLPKEGFYRLKRKLGLEQEDIEVLNPNLKETGLKAGMILKVPFADSVLNTELRAVNLIDNITSVETKRIAVMLPFRLHRIDFNTPEDTKSNIHNDRYLNASLDFYSGVLLAVDSLKTLGVSLKMDVYDTRNEVSEVSKIIQNNNFKDLDAVIGPLMSKTFEKGALELERYHVPVVSPIGTSLKMYDNVFQSKPSTDKLKSTLLNYVKTDTLVNNIVIISDSKHRTVSNELKKEFSQAKQVFSRKSKKSGKDEFFVTKSALEQVIESGKNIVFLETDNSGFVSNVTNILATLNNVGSEVKATRQIVLATTNLNNAFTSDDVSNQDLSKLQLHYASTSKLYNEIKNPFVKRYKELYHSTPNSAAVRGFDLVMDIVLRLVSSEDLYSSVRNSPLTEYVENKFAYKQKSMGGYYNDAIYIVKYQDLSIVVVE